MSSNTHLCIKNEGVVGLTGPESGSYDGSSAGPGSGHHLHIVRLRTAWEPLDGVRPCASLQSHVSYFNIILKLQKLSICLVLNDYS